jgi:hypothetical protein
VVKTFVSLDEIVGWADNTVATTIDHMSINFCCRDI